MSLIICDVIKVNNHFTYILNRLTNFLMLVPTTGLPFIYVTSYSVFHTEVCMYVCQPCDPGLNLSYLVAVQPQIRWIKVLRLMLNRKRKRSICGYHLMYFSQQSQKYCLPFSHSPDGYRLYSLMSQWSLAMSIHKQYGVYFEAESHHGPRAVFELGTFQSFLYRCSTI